MAPIMAAAGLPGSKPDNNNKAAAHKAGLNLPQSQPLLQPPPPQVLVIERMHSGENLIVQLKVFYHQRLPAL